MSDTRAFRRDPVSVTAPEDGSDEIFVQAMQSALDTARGDEVDVRLTTADFGRLVGLVGLKKMVVGETLAAEPANVFQPFIELKNGIKQNEASYREGAQKLVRELWQLPPKARLIFTVKNAVPFVSSLTIGSVGFDRLNRLKAQKHRMMIQIE